jgi:hypothetical protein
MGCVFLAEITSALHEDASFSVENVSAELEKLTADSWRRDYG